MIVPIFFLDKKKLFNKNRLYKKNIVLQKKKKGI